MQALHRQTPDFMRSMSLDAAAPVNLNLSRCANLHYRDRISESSLRSRSGYWI
jgi:hypothetical protein